MKKYLFILILLYPLILIPQEKYFIYFKDKGIKQGEALSKSSFAYSEAIKKLTDRCIERRKKAMNEDELITFEDLPIKEEYINQIQNLGIKIHNQLKWFNAVSAYLTKEQINRIKQYDFVDKVEKVKAFVYKNKNEFIENIALENKILKISGLDYGPSLDQYALSDIPQVHNKGIDGEGVLIGLLDSGFNWKTPESLSEAKVIAEHDFVFNDNNTSNETNDTPGQDSHGTYIFSVIGGYKPGEIIGPAYKASFLLAKTEYIGSETHQEEDNYAAALEWMESLGVDITGSSVGYNTFDTGQTDYTYKDMDGETTIVTKAAELAFQRGVLVVNSAGNEGNTSWQYIISPADGFNTIAVGAVNKNNQVAGFSSRGPTSDGRIKPDVLTQGVYVYGATAHSQDNYSFGQGTSAASPIASGIAALMLSLNPNLTNVEVRKILLESCDNYSSPDSNRGYGLLSASKAISVYFPTISFNNRIYYVQKKLFAKNGINASTCKIHYSVNGKDFIVSNISSIGENIFSFKLPDFNNSDIIEFYFTYIDNLNNNHQDPASNKTFRFTFGTNEVFLGNPVSYPNEYFLSNNYPNPFNSGTKIDFYAKDFEHAELIIYNVIGQKVKTLFNSLAKPGRNTIQWNGSSDNGYFCSSGVYFYVIKIRDNILSNKMVFIR